MQIKPWVVTLFKTIPVILIIVMAIWIIYSIINKKRKSTSDINSSYDNSNLYLRIFGLDIKKRTINIVFLVLGGIALLVYPMVIFANIMMLAALTRSENILDIVMSGLFVFFTSSYLLTYIICFILSFKKKDESIFVTTIPLIHIAIIVLLVTII